MSSHFNHGVRVRTGRVRRVRDPRRQAPSAGSSRVLGTAHAELRLRTTEATRRCSSAVCPSPNPYLCGGTTSPATATRSPQPTPNGRPAATGSDTLRHRCRATSDRRRGRPGSDGAEPPVTVTASARTRRRSRMVDGIPPSWPPTGLPLAFSVTTRSVQRHEHVPYLQTRWRRARFIRHSPILTHVLGERQATESATRRRSHRCAIGSTSGATGSSNVASTMSAASPMASSCDEVSRSTNRRRTAATCPARGGGRDVRCDRAW